MSLGQSTGTPSGSEFAGWGLNIGGFIKAHPDYLIRGHADGYSAQRKTDGRAKGPLLKDTTLDGLAGQIEAAS